MLYLAGKRAVGQQATKMTILWVCPTTLCLGFRHESKLHKPDTPDDSATHLDEGEDPQHPGKAKKKDDMPCQPIISPSNAYPHQLQKTQRRVLYQNIK